MKCRWGKRSWLSFALAALMLPIGQAQAAGEITVYTAQPSVSATPGESVSYSVELINNTSSVQTGALMVQGLPNEWTYELTSAGKNVKEVAVKPNNSVMATLDVNVPLEIDRGTYRFTLSAGGGNSLPMAIEVTEQGVNATELTTGQSNIEGYSDSNFKYSAQLRNRTAEKQLYALRAEAPGPGWQVAFTVSGERVSSVDVDAGATETISVQITPPEQVEAGTYTIPIFAETNSVSTSLPLQTAIIGSYDLELTTPTGLLNTDITAGAERKLKLVVKNSGTAELRNVSLKAQTPVDWTVQFEPAELASILPGETRETVATVISSKSALAGDYALAIIASSPEASSEAQFRVSVKTSVLWGWFGILIIAAVLAGLGYGFRKYGRR